MSNVELLLMANESSVSTQRNDLLAPLRTIGSSHATVSSSLAVSL